MARRVLVILPKDATDAEWWRSSAKPAALADDAEEPAHPGAEDEVAGDFLDNETAD